MKLILLLNLRQKGLENHTWALNSLTHAGRGKSLQEPGAPETSLAWIRWGWQSRGWSWESGGVGAVPSLQGHFCVPAVPPSLWEPPTAPIAPQQLLPQDPARPSNQTIKYLQIARSFSSQPPVGVEQRDKGWESSGMSPRGAGMWLAVKGPLG